MTDLGGDYSGAVIAKNNIGRISDECLVANGNLVLVELCQKDVHLKKNVVCSRRHLHRDLDRWH